MLTITIPAFEIFNEITQEFISQKEQTLQLEHSLVSLSKWESKWNKSFLYTKEKTFEESIDYIRCMTVTQHVDPIVYKGLTNENIEQVNEYIKAPMTASYVPEDKSAKKGAKNETVTAELIYYWMITLQIPFECQKWHLNRLLMLIRVCSHKSAPQKKRSQGEIMRSNHAINAARRKQLNSRG